MIVYITLDDLQRSLPLSNIVGYGSIVRVFIADDSAEICARLTTILAEIEGVKIIGQARNVHDATHSIRELKPDVVILDIQMPGNGGIDVLREIKLERPSTVVIMLTNYSGPQFQSQCKQAGADFFFDKSTEIDEAVEVLEALSRNSSA